MPSSLCCFPTCLSKNIFLPLVIQQKFRNSTTHDYVMGIGVITGNKTEKTKQKNPKTSYFHEFTF